MGLCLDSQRTPGTEIKKYAAESIDDSDECKNLY